MKHFIHPPQRSGFTLLELSIVLVIIGLIMGGITVGQDMIRSAELNSGISQIQKYEVAVNTFRLKYNGLPGDMDNASSYWPSCIDSAETTCDGNGDGTLDQIGGTTPVIDEPGRFWEHLSRAELIEGNYDGSSLGLSDNPTGAGVWLPIAEKFNSAAVFVHVSGFITPGEFHLMIGVWDEPNEGHWTGSSLNPIETNMLDEKTDDGNALTGKMKAMAGTDDSTGCVDGSGNYLLSVEILDCVPAFEVGTR